MRGLEIRWKQSLDKRRREEEEDSWTYQSYQDSKTASSDEIYDDICDVSERLGPQFVSLNNKEKYLYTCLLQMGTQIYDYTVYNIIYHIHIFLRIG